MIYLVHCLLFQLSITTLKLFETLLLKENDFITHNLILRNLLGRTYYDPARANVQSPSAERTLSQNATITEQTTSEDSKTEVDNVDIKSSASEERAGEDGVVDSNSGDQSAAAGSQEVVSQSSLEALTLEDSQPLENGPVSEISPSSPTGQYFVILSSAQTC